MTLSSFTETELSRFLIKLIFPSNFHSLLGRFKTLLFKNTETQRSPMGGPYGALGGMPIGGGGGMPGGSGARWFDPGGAGGTMPGGAGGGMGIWGIPVWQWVVFTSFDGISSYEFNMTQ